MARLLYHCVMLEIMGIPLIEIFVFLGIATMIIIAAFFVLDGTLREWLVYAGIVRADSSSYPWGEYQKRNERRDKKR